MGRKSIKQKEQEAKLAESKNIIEIPKHEFAIEFGDGKTAYFKSPSSPMISKAIAATSLDDKVEMYKKGVEFLNELFVGGDKEVLTDEFNLTASYKAITEISDLPSLELLEMSEDEKLKAKYKLQIGDDICLLKGLSNEQKIELMFSGDEDKIYINSERAFVKNFVADPGCMTTTNFVIEKKHKVCGALFLQSVFEIQEVSIKKKS
jgi:hypothetical protein